MLQSLLQCQLFHGLDVAQLESLLDSIEIDYTEYSKGDVVALQNARYSSLLILADGVLSAETTDSSNAILSLEHIEAPTLVAPSHLFAADNQLPVTLNALTAATIAVIGKPDFLTLLSKNSIVLENYLSIISNPNKFISDKMVFLTYKTIKSKLAHYFLGMMEKSHDVSLRNPLTQREMADLFGVTRPALARALGELVAEGTIYVKGKNVDVLFEEKLRQWARN